MLWDINVIPNELDNGYLMLPPGVLHMSEQAFSARLTCRTTRLELWSCPFKGIDLLCFGFGVFVALSCFCFLFCKCFGIPNSPRSLTPLGSHSLEQCQGHPADIRDGDRCEVS